MLNYELMKNLNTISSLLAGFCITIVVQILYYAQKEIAPTNNKLKFYKHKKHKFLITLKNLITKEKTAVFAFLISSILFITASISGAVISTTPEKSIPENMQILVTTTVYIFALGFILFDCGTFFISIKVNKWLSVLILILIILSIAWIITLFHLIYN